MDARWAARGEHRQPKLSCWLCTSASPWAAEISSRSDRTVHSLWLHQPLASLPAVPVSRTWFPEMQLRSHPFFAEASVYQLGLSWKLPKECRAWMQFSLKWLGMSLVWSGWKSCSWRTAWFLKTLNMERFLCLTAPDKRAVLWISPGLCFKADWEWRYIELRIFLGFSCGCSVILCSFVFTGRFPHTFFPAPVTDQDWTRGLSDLLWFLEAGMLAQKSGVLLAGDGAVTTHPCQKELWE